MHPGQLKLLLGSRMEFQVLGLRSRLGRNYQLALLPYRDVPDGSLYIIVNPYLEQVDRGLG